MRRVSTVSLSCRFGPANPTMIEDSSWLPLSAGHSIAIGISGSNEEISLTAQPDRDRAGDRLCSAAMKRGPLLKDAEKPFPVYPPRGGPAGFVAGRHCRDRCY